jgi:hypothetical protein
MTHPAATIARTCASLGWSHKRIAIVSAIVVCVLVLIRVAWGAFKLFLKLVMGVRL